MALLSKQFAKAGVKPTQSRKAVVVRAQKSDVEVASRRQALLGAAGLAALAAAAPSPSYAAYGDAANVFGRVTNKTGFVPYVGEGFALNLPSRWNPSKEEDFGAFAETQLRYEDNFDAVNNLVVLTKKTDKSSVDQLGDEQAVLQQLSFLFGKQAFAGQTISEGGFAPNRVSAASLLDIGSSTDKKGRKYYEYEMLVRTADGDEGGRHQLIKATVADGKLWVLKVQIGDKRWFKGAKEDAFGAKESFIVA